MSNFCISLSIGLAIIAFCVYRRKYRVGYLLINWAAHNEFSKFTSRCQTYLDGLVALRAAQPKAAEPEAASSSGESFSAGDDTEARVGAETCSHKSPGEPTIGQVEDELIKPQEGELRLPDVDPNVAAPS